LWTRLAIPGTKNNSVEIAYISYTNLRKGASSIEEDNHFMQEGERVTLLDLLPDWPEIGQKIFFLVNQRDGIRQLLDLDR